MTSNDGYKLVQLANGTHSVHSVAHRETFHPVVGPMVEAETLYVRQLALAGRASAGASELVVWDVGLGAAANCSAVLRATRAGLRPLRLVSFDHTKAPLEFALRHRQDLGYLDVYGPPAEVLLRDGKVAFGNGTQQVHWEFVLADFPTFIKTPASTLLPKPDAILFDAFSPAKNPAMWTLPVFADLFALLDPARPCNLATYSRSTLLRVTLLLAGWFVGCGHATGEKEETTVAANSLALIQEPLDLRWLERVRCSTSAEPMLEPVYRQAPLSASNWARLCAHPQFQKSN